MSKFLEKIDRSSSAQCSVLMIGTKLIASTFVKEDIIYIKLAQQAFRHVFLNADRNNFAYNEAHLQLGKIRLACYRLDKGALYIAMFDSNDELQKGQKTIRSATPTLNKMVAHFSKK